MPIEMNWLASNVQLYALVDYHQKWDSMNVELMQDHSPNDSTNGSLKHIPHLDLSVALSRIKDGFKK